MTPRVLLEELEGLRKRRHRLSSPLGPLPAADVDTADLVPRQVDGLHREDLVVLGQAHVRWRVERRSPVELGIVQQDDLIDEQLQVELEAVAALEGGADGGERVFRRHVRCAAVAYQPHRRHAPRGQGTLRTPCVRQVSTDRISLLVIETR